MKIWRMLIILSLSSIIFRPVYGQIVSLTEEKMVEKNVPELEFEDTSEEQDMLDTFEVQKPSFFWYWVHKLGGAMIARCTIIKRTMGKKVYQMKGWWCERKPN